MGCAHSSKVDASAGSQRRLDLNQVQPSAGPVCEGSEAEKKRFLETAWKPFVDVLRKNVLATQERHAAGVAAEDTLPPQADFVHWATKCMTLTEAWWGAGKGNLSPVYEALIEMSEHDGVTGYAFDEIPGDWSADGWVRVLDGNVRSSFYGRVGAGGGHEAMKQAVGESHIDNTGASHPPPHPFQRTLTGRPRALPTQCCRTS